LALPVYPEMTGAQMEEVLATVEGIVKKV